MKKKFPIGFLLLIAIISVTFYLQKDVSFKEITLSDAPQEIKGQVSDLPFSDKTASGITQKGLMVYATIMAQKGQQIEIVSVGKSENVGIDVFYKITKSSDSSNEHPVKIVRFLNLFGGPVGFQELD
jgi:hypothetical protein